MVASKSIDRLRWQRLIDDELDHAQRLALLKEIDSDPDRWRELALSLLEERQLAKDIPTLVCDSRMLETIRIPKPFEAESISKRTGLAGIGKGRSENGLSHLYFKNFYWAMAASIIFVFGGFAMGSAIRGWTDRKQADDGQSPNYHRLASETGSPMTDPDQPWNWKEAGRLQLTSHGGIDQPVEVPVYEVSELDAQFLHGVDSVLTKSDTERLRKIEAELRRRGLSLDVETQFLEGQLTDGRQLIVPVQNVQVRPYGQ